MHEEWIAQLSPYLDGELPSAAHARVEEHLASCLGCREALEQIRLLVLAAPEYPGEPPSARVWHEIAAAIAEERDVSFPRERRVRPRPAWSVRHLVAAGIAVAVLSGGTVWLAMRGGTEGIAPPGPGATAAVSFAEASYDAAVADLERLLDAERSRLRPETVQAIESNLAVIDRAIAEARAAIARDPQNAFLATQVAANMRRKLSLLRQAVRAAEASL